MALVNCMQMNITGDIGGNGLSRFYAQNGTETALGTADANSMASAVASLYQFLSTLNYNTLTFTLNPTYQCINIPDGALTAEDVITTLPAPVSGAEPGDAPAGVGARGYWHTGTIRGRRIVRGATFFTGFISSAYTATGGLTTASATHVETGMANYLAAMATAALVPVIYGRPHTIEAADGIVAPIIAASCGETPASLRSRRS